MLACLLARFLSANLQLWQFGHVIYVGEKTEGKKADKSKTLLVSLRSPLNPNWRTKEERKRERESTDHKKAKRLGFNERERRTKEESALHFGLLTHFFVLASSLCHALSGYG